jgi:hypothetical protein
MRCLTSFTGIDAMGCARIPVNGIKENAEELFPEHSYVSDMLE